LNDGQGARSYDWRLGIALSSLAIGFPGSTDGSCTFARTSFGGLLVVLTKLHLAIYTFTLQLLLQHPKGLVDVVISDDDLHNSASDYLAAGTERTL